jgi:hypothetical protein
VPPAVPGRFRSRLGNLTLAYLRAFEAIRFPGHGSRAEHWRFAEKDEVGGFSLGVLISEASGRGQLRCDPPEPETDEGRKLVCDWRTLDGHRWRYFETTDSERVGRRLLQVLTVSEGISYWIYSSVGTDRPRRRFEQLLSTVHLG